jgi:hypothetical protein
VNVPWAPAPRGVHHPLRDPFVVDMRDLLPEVVVLQGVGPRRPAVRLWPLSPRTVPCDVVSVRPVRGPPGSAGPPPRTVRDGASGDSGGGAGDGSSGSETCAGTRAAGRSAHGQVRSGDAPGCLPLGDSGERQQRTHWAACAWL